VDRLQSNTSTDQEQGIAANVVPIADRLMWNRRDAAYMCGVSVSTFSKWVREGFMPQPLRNGRFSADAVRKALAASLQSVAANDSAYDRWRASRD
jgi:predicted DNA-binding transcriptional regulator AlpA